MAKNISTGKNSFKIFSNGSEYSFRLNVSNNKIELILCEEDSLEIFNEIFTLENIISTQCFKMEENFDEVLLAMKKLYPSR